MKGISGKGEVGYVYVAGLRAARPPQPRLEVDQEANPDVKQVAQFGKVSDSTAYDTQEQANAAITAHPDVKAVLAPYDEFAKGVVLRARPGEQERREGLRRRHLDADIAVLTKPDSPWVATIATDPANVGRVAVRAAALKFNGDPVDHEVLIKPCVITQQFLLRERHQDARAAARRSCRSSTPRTRRPASWIPQGSVRHRPARTSRSRSAPRGRCATSAWSLPGGRGPRRRRAPTGPASRRSTRCSSGALAPDSGARADRRRAGRVRLAARRAPRRHRDRPPARVGVDHPRACQSAENLRPGPSSRAARSVRGCRRAGCCRARARSPKALGLRLSRRRAARRRVAARRLRAPAHRARAALVALAAAADARRADLRAVARRGRAAVRRSCAALREQRRRDPLRVPPARGDRGARGPRRGAARRGARVRSFARPLRAPRARRGDARRGGGRHRAAVERRTGSDAVVRFEGARVFEASESFDLELRAGEVLGLTGLIGAG